MVYFFAGAYWGRRRESSRCCAERLALCVARLGEADEVLSCWFHPANSRSAAFSPVALDVDSLQELLEKGVQRTDIGNELMPDLGFSVSMWNGNDVEVDLSASVGMYPDTPTLTNSVSLGFPALKQETGRLYERSVAAAVMDALVEPWEPDWAAWSSTPLYKAQQRGMREPLVGWMTYVASPVEVEIPGVSQRPLMSGTVLEMDKECHEVTEADVVRLRAILAEAGVMKPSP